MPKVNPEGTIARKDGDKDKRFPNGLKATLKAIRKYWCPQLRSDFKHNVGRTPLKFAADFRATYNRVGGYYSETVRSQEAIAAAVCRLEGNGSVNVSDIKFWQLRAYAEYVEVPSSLLLLFGQLVSYESQGHSREEIANFASNCANAIRAIQLYMSQKEGDCLFHKKLSESEFEVEFVAILKGLYKMSSAFGGWAFRLQSPSQLHRNSNM